MTKPEPIPIPTHRKLLFAAVTLVLFFGLVELALALFGVEPVTVTEDPYVGFASHARLFRPAGEVFETAPEKLALFNYQTFRRSKPRGSVRIFTVGGSTTYGRPFADATSFSGWLRAYLAALGKGRFEVINAGGISYASYRVAKLMEELADYQPDLFIIYSGNNEFLEKRTYGDLIAEPEILRGARGFLRHSRLWALGRGLVDRPRRGARQRYELTGEVEELLNNSAGLDLYRRDEAFERQVLDHYRFNLRRMLELARAAGAGVILVTVPVNEKDFAPFKSQYSDGLGDADRRRHRDLLARASEALGEQRAEEARELAAAAVLLDPLFADGHYLLGRALWSLGRSPEAATAFGRAIAEDVCPLRALGEVQDAVRAAAAEHGAELVDFRGDLERRSGERAGHPILGEEDFLDHVHPTVETHGLLAGALVERVAEIGFLELAPDWRQRVGEQVREQVLAEVDDEAIAGAYKNLSKVLLWAGKRQEAEKYLAKARSLSAAGDWELHYHSAAAAFAAGDAERALAGLREAVRLRPGAAPAWDLLGAVYAASGELELAIEAGRKAVELDPEMADAWNNLGSAYELAGDRQRALETIGRALRLRPEFADAHNNLGNVDFALGRLDRALASYERALEQRPGFARALVNRGLVLGEQGELRRALESFGAALELDAGLAEAHFGKGRALVELGEPSAAVAALERSLELEPRHAEAWRVLVGTLISTAGLDRAREALARGLAANPRVAALHHLSGRLEAQQKNYRAAERSFRQALELDAELLSAWQDLGMLQMVAGRYQEAAQVFQDALEIYRDESGIHYSLGRALMMSQRVGEAVSHLAKALELDPGNALAANDLAAIYEHLGELERALELYRRAARLDPDLTLARDNAARLGASLNR